MTFAIANKIIIAMKIKRRSGTFNFYSDFNLAVWQTFLQLPNLSNHVKDGTVEVSLTILGQSAESTN